MEGKTDSVRQPESLIGRVNGEKEGRGSGKECPRFSGRYDNGWKSNPSIVAINQGITSASVGGELMMAGMMGYESHVGEPRRINNVGLHVLEGMGTRISFGQGSVVTEKVLQKSPELMELDSWLGLVGVEGASQEFSVGLGGGKMKGLKKHDGNGKGTSSHGKERPRMQNQGKVVASAEELLIEKLKHKRKNERGGSWRRNEES